MKWLAKEWPHSRLATLQYDIGNLFMYALQKECLWAILRDAKGMCGCTTSQMTAAHAGQRAPFPMESAMQAAALIILAEKPALLHAFCMQAVSILVDIHIGLRLRPIMSFLAQAAMTTDCIIAPGPASHTARLSSRATCQLFHSMHDVRQHMI